ncbi:hypothetical protein [Pararhodobacter zhoushanensis]|uniref:hypothetical protein n=1 Tax=Pararhodobacter zhoushanensis TaxID=2479545 RepID=UPI0013DFB0F0|nr:hypothetical protein [Pararhodobacter zhoushanensis]
MAQVILKIRIPRWRIRAARPFISALSVIEWLLPGTIAPDRWCDRVAAWVSAGIRVDS